nr:MAG TPA_asm: peptidase [Caudoviricetes sp.]
MAIKQYSLAKDGAKLLAPGFRVREFRCKDSSDEILVDEALVLLLQCIREHFGKAVTITSGYRTAAHNAAVGGSKSSQHLLGRAADIQVAGISVEDVAAYAESLMPDWGGVGRYPVKAGRATGWVHVDTRQNKSRWTL